MATKEATLDVQEMSTPPDLIKPPEAAHALGVSQETLKAARLHRLQSNPLRDLPYVRIGRSVRYRRRDIVEWIEQNTVRPGKREAI